MATKKVNNPKAYIICDQRRKRKDDTAPIRLIVKHEGKQKVYGLDIYLTQADFDQTKKKNFSGNLAEAKKEDLCKIKIKIAEKESKAKDIINTLPVFTFPDFEDRMFGSVRDTLFTALEAKIADMIKAQRIGNASTYMCTLKTLRLFRGGIRERDGRSVTVSGGNDINLKKITKEFLNEFENWYINQKKSKGKYSKTSVGIYVRNIRVILNEAIDAKVIERDVMPFGDKKYRIPGSSKRKFALKLDNMSTIVSAMIQPGSLREKYRDYFVFSYFAQGMNLADMARLRYEDIDSEKISYIRAKTAFKKLEEPEFITVPLLPELGKIIDMWGNKPALPESYVFPILKPEMTPMDEFQVIRATLKSINTNIKIIAKVLEIEGNISFYVARHSYATILKNSGVSVQAISENLGHSSPKVTQDYFAGFDIEDKVKQAEHLRKKASM